MISVLMSVYNNEDTVERAVRSILEQTHKDFEFIIIDDGSFDGSSEVLETLADQDDRIILVHQENIGLTPSLNKAAFMAKGEFLARLDGDDFALPRRLEKQIFMFERDPELVLLGSNSVDIYEDGRRENWGYYSDDDIVERVKLCTPFPHSSVMMRASNFETVGGYNEAMQTSQDMELWMRMAKMGKISMIEEPLIERSVHSQAISSRRKFQQFKDSYGARRRLYEGSPLYALYFSIRSYCIALLPPALIRTLKKL